MLGDLSGLGLSLDGRGTGGGGSNAFGRGRYDLAVETNQALLRVFLPRII